MFCIRGSNFSSCTCLALVLAMSLGRATAIPLWSLYALHLQQFDLATAQAIGMQEARKASTGQDTTMSMSP